MKHSSISPPISPTKYDDPARCLRLLHLLETEEAVTRTRMGDALGISRMTAHRIAEQFISRGLMAERIGQDPISGRRSHLLTLAPEPPLLLLEVWAEKPWMTAYLYNGEKITQLRADYRLTTNVEGNVLTLCDLAKAWWHLSHDTVSVVLYRQGGTPRFDLRPFKEMYAIREDVAIAHTLNLHPALGGYHSLLHLRLDHHSSGALYVRACQGTPWFLPSGAQLTAAFPYATEPADLNHRDVSDFLKAYCQCIRPDVILWEDSEPRPRHGNGSLGEETIPSYGLKLSPLEKDSEAAALFREAHLPVLTCKRNFPLWVAGAVSLRREMLWSDTQPFLPYP